MPQGGNNNTGVQALQTTGRFEELILKAFARNENELAVDAFLINEANGEIIAQAGGGSEFTIVQVTIINNRDSQVHVMCPYLYEDYEDGQLVEAYAFGYYNMGAHQTAMLPAILWNGAGSVMIQTSAHSGIQDYTYTEDMEDLGSGLLIIHGSGTITINTDK